ncbi:MAG: hypothetical protein HC834_04805 [Rhodospirillales bacterium]|nr:hypothetical protein [Rhodospirillales bacterium]
MKIDVEGAELDVLNGMLRTLDTYRPDLFIELHYAIPALIPLLIQKNYCVYHIEGQAWMTPDSPPISWGHVLCSKEQGTGKK